MALKLRYRTQEEIPAELRGHYAERNGAFTLDVEGAVAVEELEQARQAGEALKAEKAALQGELAVARTEEAAVAEGRLLGLMDCAVTDLRHRARHDLTLDAGKTARKGADGKPQPIAIGDWVQEQKRQAPHLFEQGTGTGAAGVRTSESAHTGPNPFSKDSFNLTKQAELRKSNPQEAARLQAEAN